MSSEMAVSESITDKLLKEIKPLIQQGKLKELQMLWKVYSDEKRIKRPVVFQKAILYAANRKQHAIYDWIESLLDTLSPTDRNEVQKVYAYSYFIRHHVIEESEEESEVEVD